MTDFPIPGVELPPVAARDFRSRELDQVQATVQALQGAASLLQGAMEQRQELLSEMRTAHESLAALRLERAQAEQALLSATNQLDRAAREVAQVRAEQSGVVAEFDKLVHSALQRRSALVIEIADLERQRDGLTSFAPVAPPTSSLGSVAVAPPEAPAPPSSPAAPLTSFGSVNGAPPEAPAPPSSPAAPLTSFGSVNGAPPFAVAQATLPEWPPVANAWVPITPPAEAAPLPAAEPVEPVAEPPAPVAAEPVEPVAEPPAPLAAEPVHLQPIAPATLVFAAEPLPPPLAPIVAAPTPVPPTPLRPIFADDNVSALKRPIFAADTMSAIKPLFAAEPSPSTVATKTIAPTTIAPQRTAAAASRFGPREVATAFIAVMLVGLALLLTPVLQVFGGTQLLAVMSGSMEPTIQVGGIVSVRPVPVAELQVGDVITFATQSNPDILVTHRIVGLEARDNQRLVTTKGDANDSVDAVAAPVSRAVGRVDFTLPWLGYLMVWLASPLAKVGILVISVIGFALPSAKRNSASAELSEAEPATPVRRTEPTPIFAAAPTPSYAALEREIESLLPRAS